MKRLYTFGIIISLLILWYYLCFPFEFLRFDFIKGFESRPSYSDNKAESKKRGVFICDVYLEKSPYKINEDFEVELIEGWVERDWLSGVWFWTTKISKRKTFNIVIEFDKVYSKDRFYRFKSRPSKSEPQGNYIGCIDNSCLGELKQIHELDTLKYYLYKENIIGFNDSLVIGTLGLVFTHPNGK